jgi:hypothetical protein
MSGVDDFIGELRKRGLKGHTKSVGLSVNRRKIVARTVQSAAVVGAIGCTLVATYSIVFDTRSKCVLETTMQQEVCAPNKGRLKNILAYDTFVFLTTTGANSWTVPANWNSLDNRIECIGAGGNGAGPYNAGNPVGGHGGTYASVTNLALTPGASASYNISAGNTGDTWLSNTGVAPTNTTQGVLAKPNQTTTTGCIGSATFAGGTSASGYSSGFGTGGGGAASRGGKGGNASSPGSGNNYSPGGGGAGTTAAGNNASGATPGTGGATGGGNGGAGVTAVVSQNGVAGAAGTSFTATLGGTAGAGGGGGCGQGAGRSGGNGGLYGGGGGNIRSTGAGTPGVGAQGFILISFTALILASDVAGSYAYIVG